MHVKRVLYCSIFTLLSFNCLNYKADILQLFKHMLCSICASPLLPVFDHESHLDFDGQCMSKHVCVCTIIICLCVSVSVCEREQEGVGILFAS